MLTMVADLAIGDKFLNIAVDRWPDRVSLDLLEHLLCILRVFFREPDTDSQARFCNELRCLAFDHDVWFDSWRLAWSTFHLFQEYNSYSSFSFRH